MTTKRDGKRNQAEAKSAKPPKLKKETLKDLDAEKQGENVKGGANKKVTIQCQDYTIDCPSDAC